MVVQRDKILRRRQGGQMALSLDGAEALQMMLTRRHGYCLAVPIKTDNPMLLQPRHQRDAGVAVWGR